MINKDCRYGYLLKEEELEFIDISIFDELYPSDHPTARRFQTNKVPYAVGLSNQILPSFKKRFRYFPIDNPILLLTDIGSEFLTHYLLRKDNNAIAGTVTFTRTGISNGDYVGRLTNGEEEFRTCGQTAWLTEEEITRYEKNGWGEYHLHPIQMVWFNP